MRVYKVKSQIPRAGVQTSGEGRGECFESGLPCHIEGLLPREESDNQIYAFTEYLSSSGGRHISIPALLCNLVVGTNCPSLRPIIRTPFFSCCERGISALNIQITRLSDYLIIKTSLSAVTYISSQLVADNSVRQRYRPKILKIVI